MIDNVVMVLIAISMILVIAYMVIATVCCIRQHKVQMRIDKKFDEALERRLIGLDDDPATDEITDQEVTDENDG